MATKLFVGALSYNTTDAGLEEFFATAGTVVSAKVIIDRDTNRSKGFGFVEMASDEEAKTAIAQLNGKELDGRTIAVNEARPREERPAGGNGGGFRRERNNDRDRGNRY
jgi:RNA recognition motif-containing protein